MDFARPGFMLVSTAVACAASIIVLVRFAKALGVVDAPGGRKAHANSVPLVGGLGIFIALLVMAWVFRFTTSNGYLLFAMSVILAVGLWDDVIDISPKLKFAIEIAASSIMIWSGVQLFSVGDLIGWRSIGLSVFAVPLTIFAVVGVVNAVNMIDGIDGLAGCISLVAFGWFWLVAAQSGLESQAMMALLFCGAIAGFLLFNLRFPWQRHAGVFLGDAGSLMLGFALAWYAIDLTQGPGRTFPPIAALWVILLPLADCVSLMLRRMRTGRSPFVADRQHIHHYLLARGFSHGQTLAILVALSVIFGGVGYWSWIFGVEEVLLFYPFFFGFFAYHAWIQREWQRLERRGTAIVSGSSDDKEGAATAD